MKKDPERLLEETRELLAEYLTTLAEAMLWDMRTKVQEIKQKYTPPKGRRKPRLPRKLRESLK